MVFSYGADRDPRLNSLVGQAPRVTKDSLGEFLRKNRQTSAVRKGGALLIEIQTQKIMVCIYCSIIRIRALRESAYYGELEF